MASCIVWCDCDVAIMSQRKKYAQENTEKEEGREGDGRSKARAGGHAGSGGGGPRTAAAALEAERVDDVAGVEVGPLGLRTAHVQHAQRPDDEVRPLRRAHRLPTEDAEGG